MCSGTAWQDIEQGGDYLGIIFLTQCGRVRKTIFSPVLDLEAEKKKHTMRHVYIHERTLPVLDVSPSWLVLWKTVLPFLGFDSQGGDHLLRRVRDDLPIGLSRIRVEPQGHLQPMPTAHELRRHCSAGFDGCLAAWSDCGRPTHHEM
jgi:hypothetical protein